MMEVVRGYLLRLTAGAFLSAGLLALIPKGTSKKAAAVLCGLVMLLLALTPLAQLDYDALSEAISRLELEKEEARTGIEIRNQELVARIISGRVQAYILDKAASLGLTVTVELEMETRAASHRRLYALCREQGRISGAASGRGLRCHMDGQPEEYHLRHAGWTQMP